MGDRSSMNPEPESRVLQIWRNQKGVLHVGKSGWEAMVVYENGSLVALDKRGKTWMHRDLSESEWERVRAEMAKGKKS